MEPQIFLIAAFAVTFAGFSKGGFGGGAAFVSSTILALVLTPAQAIGIMLPLLMVMDLGTVRSFWKQWDWPRSRLVILGSIPGVALGTLLYSVTNDDVLRLLIGVIAVGFVIWRMVPKSGLKDANFSRGVGLFAGAVTGFTSFVSHAGGPPAAVYLLSQRLDKTTYHASATLIFWVVNALKVVPYTFLGIFTFESLRTDLFLLPFALIGVWLGVRAHHLVPERVFFGLTYVLLSGTGAKLIFDALT